MRSDAGCSPPPGAREDPGPAWRQRPRRSEARGLAAGSSRPCGTPPNRRAWSRPAGTPSVAARVVPPAGHGRPTDPAHAGPRADTSPATPRPGTPRAGTPCPWTPPRRSRQQCRITARGASLIRPTAFRERASHPLPRALCPEEGRAGGNRCLAEPGMPARSALAAGRDPWRHHRSSHAGPPRGRRVRCPAGPVGARATTGRGGPGR